MRVEGVVCKQVFKKVNWSLSRSWSLGMSDMMEAPGSPPFLHSMGQRCLATPTSVSRVCLLVLSLFLFFKRSHPNKSDFCLRCMFWGSFKTPLCSHFLWKLLKLASLNANPEQKWKIQLHACRFSPEVTLCGLSLGHRLGFEMCGLTFNCLCVKYLPCHVSSVGQGVVSATEEVQDVLCLGTYSLVNENQPTVTSWLHLQLYRRRSKNYS